MDRWEGKVAVVTGASSGIGATIASALVSAGLKVAGLARRLDRLEALAEELENQKGKLYPIKTDITKEEDILAAFKWIKEQLGPIHILINNAGVSRCGNLYNGKTEDFKQVLDTNVFGLTITTREAITDMRANNVDGHIVHINSVGGHYINNIREFNIYPASKFAVTALTETLRRELVSIGSKIKISSVSPGYVATEILEKGGFTGRPKFDDFMSKVPSLQSEDIANAVLYVLGTPPSVQITELIIRPVEEIVRVKRRLI